MAEMLVILVAMLGVACLAIAAQAEYNRSLKSLLEETERDYEEVVDMKNRAMECIRAQDKQIEQLERALAAASIRVKAPRID